MKHLQNQTNPHTIVYMEVYGMNRVIYQVTACQASKKSRQAAVYGVSLPASLFRQFGRNHFLCKPSDCRERGTQSAL